MKLRPLHPLFGVEVQNIDLRQVTQHEIYPELRALFEEHSLLLFRNQRMNNELHNSFAALFGPLEDRLADTARATPRIRPPVSALSNREVDEILPADSLQVLNLIANQLWHTDSTFLHTPALANVITAYVLPSSGGETELVSTRAAWRDLPEKLRQQALAAVLLHSVLPSRLRTDPRLAELAQVNRYQSQAWRAVWPNPVNGELSLYLAGHVYGVRGMGDVHAAEFVNKLLTFSTRSKYRYAHRWQAGDVLLWDERATMHRGRPWPYAEERTLGSCCVTATSADGLAGVHPADGPVTEDEMFRWSART